VEQPGGEKLLVHIGSLLTVELLFIDNHLGGVLHRLYDRIGHPIGRPAGELRDPWNCRLLAVVVVGIEDHASGGNIGPAEFVVLVWFPWVVESEFMAFEPVFPIVGGAWHRTRDLP